MGESKGSVAITMPDNPCFRSVRGLTNTTFDEQAMESGRGATEGQMKELFDRCRELEAHIAEIENSDTLNAIIAEMRGEVDDLRTMIENCCYTLLAGSADGLGGTSDGADIAVGITWDADPLTNGGQMSAVSSNGAEIAMYYFLVQKGDGIFLKMKAANYAGRIVSVDQDTGVITVTEGSGSAMDKIIAGATDANGCEGLAAFSITAAPWHTT